MSPDKNRRRSIVGLFQAMCAATVLALSFQAFAHHSVSGQYDVNSTLELTGIVERVDWVNPHIYVHLRVTDESGVVAVWRLGTVPVAMARRAGITSERLFAEGMTVKATVFPSRDGTENMGFLTRMDYPDGTFISVRPDRL